MSIEKLTELLSDGEFLARASLIVFGTYLLIYSALQVREVKVLQRKVTTSGDLGLIFLGVIYFLIQALIFVVALIIL